MFFAIDLVKEELTQAYSTRDEDEMADHLTHVVEICEGTKNVHFKWFSNLILKHWNGLISHAVLRLSNGKIEGINNRIKTVRRMSYGFRDDEYFFLKLMDMSRYHPA
ncbi:MAG: transposase [Erysipelotrichaceae bacterium]|nr:transposase [Erysipelotrichaceae bacterium]